jgi:hypothetical protein
MATCVIHKKNRKIQFLEPIPGSNMYRCSPGNECQTGHNTPMPDPFSSPLIGGMQVTPLSGLNPTNMQYGQPQPLNNNYQTCTVHHKIRGLQYLDQYQANDGSIAYKCKEGDECKVCWLDESTRSI